MNDTLTNDNHQKEEILREKFFPGRVNAELSDIDKDLPPKRLVPIDMEVTPEEIENVLRQLPRGKAPGPDEIPNEILQLVLPEWKSQLAAAITQLFLTGQIPDSYKESVTVTLRKDRRPDYSIPSSYRPISLENSLAKFVEKIVAKRMMTAAEQNGMLPWTQMGARQKRSTISALELLTSTVQTAWQASPGCVVSMLGLDIKGAFDNISTERLIWVLRREGFPEWIVKYVNNFVTRRRTKIRFTGYTGDWIKTEVGIPQGSHLSPILFLFYISELIESLQCPDQGYMAFGFVDDTTIVTWSNSARKNCRSLEQAHDKCLAWAKRYGATFAPEKYQLIHFDRKRGIPRSNEGIQIEGVTISPKKEIKILGILVDKRLRWGAQVDQAVQRGEAAFNAMCRFISSVWGPSLRLSRLIYSAVVRPTILYGSQIWGMRYDGHQLPKSIMGKLQKLQNHCLRRITGAYKRTPRVVLEKEASIPPIDLYIRTASLKYGTATKNNTVTKAITQHLDYLGKSINQKRGRAGRDRRKLTAMELVRKDAETIVHEAQERNPNRSGPGYRRLEERKKKRSILALHKWMSETWQKRWSDYKGARTAATWKTPWTQSTLELYNGLKKHEATALMLLRSEIIGLNAWLSSIKVPNISAACTCGEPFQTVKHILFFCPEHQALRAQMLANSGTSSFDKVLQTPKGCRAASRMFIATSRLTQFAVANKIDTEEQILVKIPILN